MKPRALVCVLCGPERTDWIHPKLSTVLVAMSHDPRFEVQIDWQFGGRPVAYARNLCVSKARSLRVDWLLMLDNDVAPISSPLELITTAPKDAAVIGLSYGIPVDGGFRFADDARNPSAGFPEATTLGAGCLLIRSHVWQAIPKGPWFKWETGTDELLSPQGGCGEDVFFCRLVRKYGLKLYTHQQLAAHHKTVDVTAMILKLGRVQKAML